MSLGVPWGAQSIIKICKTKIKLVWDSMSVPLCSNEGGRKMGHILLGVNVYELLEGLPQITLSTSFLEILLSEDYLMIGSISLPPP